MEGRPPGWPRRALRDAALLVAVVAACEGGAPVPRHGVARQYDVEAFRAEARARLERLDQLIDGVRRSADDPAVAALQDSSEAIERRLRTLSWEDPAAWAEARRGIQGQLDALDRAVLRAVALAGEGAAHRSETTFTRRTQ